MGTIVAGSVDAIIDPAKRHVIKFILKLNPIIFAIQKADITTPKVDNRSTDILTFFNTFKLTSFPPMYKINADPNVNIS